MLREKNIRLDQERYILKTDQEFVVEDEED